MAHKAGKHAKAATLMLLAIAVILVLNLALTPVLEKWSLLAAFGLATLVMWPVLHYFLKQCTYAGILYKIDSKKGLKFIDRLGTGHSSFWIAIGDIALMLSFGGLGAAFATGHVGKKGRAWILAALAFLTIFVYMGRNVISFFPFGVYVSADILTLGVSLLVAWFAYKSSYSFSEGKASLAAFIMALSFFGSPYLLDYSISGSPYSLAMGFTLGAIGLPALVIFPLFVQGVNIAVGASQMPGINPGYPEMENGVPVLKYAGTNISIPFFPDILIAFIIMIALHECFHGLVARAQGIPLKHTGLLFLSIIPLGAFVEPDEARFKKERLDKQMRVYAAGSFANIFVVALGVFLLANLMASSGIVNADGFVIGGVVKDSAADGFLRPGDVVSNVGGVKTLTFFDFSGTMKSTKPGDNLTMVTQRGPVSIQLGESPSYTGRGFVGVELYNDPIMAMFTPSLSTSHIEPSAGAAMLSLMKWVFFLNLMLGIMNLLPLRFFDGGYAYGGMFYWVGKKLGKKKGIKIANAVSSAFGLLVLALFLINLSPYLF